MRESGGGMSICESRAMGQDVSTCESKATGQGIGAPSPPPSNPPSSADAVETLAAELGKMTLEQKPQGAVNPIGWEVKPMGWDDDGGDDDTRSERVQYPQMMLEQKPEGAVNPTGWGVKPMGWDDDGGDDDTRSEKDLPPPPSKDCERVQYPQMMLEQKPEGAVNPTGWVVKPMGWDDDDDDGDDTRSEGDLPPPAASKEGDCERVQYPQRPGDPDCAFFVRTGTCKFGSNCRFNHPPIRKQRNRVRSKKPSEQIQMGLPTTCRSPTAVAAAAEASCPQSKSLTLEEKLEEKSEGDGYHEYPGSEGNAKPEESMSPKEGKNETFSFPRRPDRSDCSHYLKTGNCQFGSNCKFNHPPRRRGNKVAREKEKKCSEENVGKGEGKKDFKGQMKEAPLRMLEKAQSKIDKGKQNRTLPGRTRMTESKAVEEKETTVEREGHTDCKYSVPGGGKFGKASKNAHISVNSEPGSVDLNFLGLPLRPGERECTNYMHTGGCKFATNCRYHHPDPIAVAGQDTLSGYQNGASFQQHASGASALPMTSWSLPMAPCEALPYFDASPPYAPGFYPLPPQGFYPNPGWSGYQVPMTPWLPQEMNTGNYSGPKISSADTHQQAQIGEYPELPGRPPCTYFMKNGDCKLKSACRFNHPKTAPKARQ